ncbi:MAG: ketoacyl-ACP synthase III [Methylococcales bacterium]
MQTSSIGREVKTTGASIVGVVSCVPSWEVENNYFFDKFGEVGVNDAVKMIGVKKRRWANDQISTRDLCHHAGKRLLNKLDWNPETIDAIIFVSQTPDYRLPASACILQADLGLSNACIAFDINLGCSGYPHALWLGMTMIQSGAARRVLLAVGDTISKIINPDDRATALLFGDAGTMTALEADSSDNQAHFIMGTDGRGMSNLIVPKGAFKNYTDVSDTRLEDKDPSCLFMDGAEVFNFTLQSVPSLVKRTFEFAEKNIDDYDAFLFHQANLFMIKHLIKKTKLPSDKAPINIDDFGNTSCASIPLLMTTKLKEPLKNNALQLAMFGFGVGYSWASASVKVGNLKVIESIEL